MQSSACCIDSPGHKCDWILVYGDALRVLLSSSAADSAIHNHVDGLSDSGLDVAFFCKDDLALHLGNVVDTGHLEQFLDLLVTIKNIELGPRFGAQIRDDSNCLSPIPRQYGCDEEPFQESFDTECLVHEVQFSDCWDTKPRLPKYPFQKSSGSGEPPPENPFRDPDTEPPSPENPFEESSDFNDRFPPYLASSPEDPFEDSSHFEKRFPPFSPPAADEPVEGSSDFEKRFPPLPPQPTKMTGEWRRSLRSHIASIRHRSRPLLCDNYHRVPHVVAEYLPHEDCSTCRKCEEAVEREW
jgi:hypothetical protein